jgi:hypothetical protein
MLDGKGEFVIPAKAGIQKAAQYWTPAPHQVRGRLSAGVPVRMRLNVTSERMLPLCVQTRGFLVCPEYETALCLLVG